jgi:hypothetical protein
MKIVQAIVSAFARPATRHADDAATGLLLAAARDRAETLRLNELLASRTPAAQVIDETAEVSR